MRLSKRSAYVSVMLLAVLLVLSSSLLAAGDPKLVDAVKKSDIKTVRALLQAKVDVNSASADGTTALHWAVDGDNREIAKVLVAAGANAKSRNSYGITPLTIACINADPDMVELLLKAGADPNTVFSEGESAIMTAARTGNAKVVKLLLDAGANADAKEPTKGQTAMMWAAIEGHADVTQILKSREADVKAKTLGGYDSIMYATREGHTDVVKALLDAGVDVNEKTPEGMTLLNLAIFNAHYDTASLLVNRGADVNLADRAQGPPLANLMKMRRSAGCQNPCPRNPDSPASLELAKLLLEAGANVKATVAGGRGGGGAAFGNGADVIASIGALKAEMAVKADPNASGDFYKYAGLFSQGGGFQGDAGQQQGYGNGRGNYNVSALSAATQAAIAAAVGAKQQDTDLNDDADADAAAAAAAAAPRGRGGAPAPGMSLFQLALMNADLEMGKLLLAKGANPTEPLGKVTALMLAAGPTPTANLTVNGEASNHEAFELVKMIYDLGATDVNAVDEQGATALHAAAKRGSTEIIQFLVDHGAKLDIDTTFGWSPLDTARGYRDFLGVGRRDLSRGRMQPEVAAFVEKLMKDRGLPTEHFGPGTK
jgi:ankyrin repeat protein